MYLKDCNSLRSAYREWQNSEDYYAKRYYAKIILKAFQDWEWDERNYDKLNDPEVIVEAKKTLYTDELEAIIISRATTTDLLEEIRRRNGIYDSFWK